MNAASKSLQRSLAIRTLFHRDIATVSSENAMFQSLCNVLVANAGYRMAWFGIAENDKSVRPVAVAGFDEGYVENLKIRWDDSLRAQGPTGTAIRTKVPCITWDWTRLADARLKPWRDEALRRKYASSVALPLLVDGKIIGALTLYSTETGDLGDGELLASLMNDLSEGVKRLRKG